MRSVGLGEGLCRLAGARRLLGMKGSPFETWSACPLTTLPHDAHCAPPPPPPSPLQADAALKCLEVLDDTPAKRSLQLLVDYVLERIH